MKLSSISVQSINIIKHIRQRLSPSKKMLEKDVFVKAEVPEFKEIIFKKSLNLKEAALFAEKNFGVKNFNINDLVCANLLNKVFTKIHNITKGKAEFPPIVSIRNQKNVRFSGECGTCHIEVIKHPQMINTIIHEIGHYNHQKCCSDFSKMGKYQELIDDGVTDFSIYEQFKNDKQSLKLIKKHILPYATSSAAEFIACTFNSIINGKTLPKEIYELYKKYEGPFADIFIANAMKTA